MIVYARELSATVRDDILPLVKRHWEEVAPGLGEADPPVDLYVRLTDMGVLRIFTARDNGALVGYALFWVKRDLHQRKLTSAILDALWVEPKYRRTRDLVAPSLLALVEEVLRKEGVDRIYAEGPVGATSFHSLLRKRAYTDLGRSHYKDL